MIEDTQGTKPYLQDLIIVPQAASCGGSKDAEMSEDAGAALAEDGVIGPCSVLLCVKVETGLLFVVRSCYSIACLLISAVVCVHCSLCFFLLFIFSISSEDDFPLIIAWQILLLCIHRVWLLPV